MVVQGYWAEKTSFAKEVSPAILRSISYLEGSSLAEDVQHLALKLFWVGSFYS